MMMKACMRCGAQAVTRDASGLLRLCASCVLAVFCGEHRHTYHALDGEGRWICTYCGTVLLSQAISLAEPSAAAAVQDYDC